MPPSSSLSPCHHRRIIFAIPILLILHIGCVVPLSGPSSLTILSRGENNVAIQWSPPNSPSLIIREYHVVAEPLKWFRPSKPTRSLEWKFMNSTRRAELFGLEPGSNYRISLWASTDKGDTDRVSETTWTEIGEPEPPLPVEVLERRGRIMRVRLHPGTSNYGPISGYLVIVVEQSPSMFFSLHQLFNHSYAEYSGIPYYVAANLTESQIADVFHVGDGRTYGNYYNAPLNEDVEYEILQGVVSSMHGVTKMSHSPLEGSYPQPDTINFNSFKSQDSAPSRTTSALMVAIGVFGFLLAASVVIYFLLRRHYGKRKALDEIVLQMQASGEGGEENGFIPSNWQVDDDTNTDDFYDSLKGKFWQIPRHQLHIGDAVLGPGKYGEVRRGAVHRKGQEIPVLVQTTQTQDTLTDEKEWRSLLSELNAAIRLGHHPNLVEFIGMCEEREASSVMSSSSSLNKRAPHSSDPPLLEKLDWVVEHHPKTLKDALLDARKVQATANMTNAPYGTSAFSARQLVEVALGIARGLAHLAANRMCHCHLSSYAVLMTDQMVPKVTNFGFAYYAPLSKHPDFVRWKAPETLRFSRYHWKSDVWSFGVILWEIFTFGGTPYVDIHRDDVPKMVTNGIRLPHPRGISDELFQMLLHCWETDLDERTTFQELCSFFERIVDCAAEHINLHPSLIHPYHRYDPSA